MIFIIIILNFSAIIPFIRLEAYTFKEWARVLCLLSLYEIWLVNVLWPVIMKNSLFLQSALHSELEFLTAYIKKFIEDWTVHLKKLN